MQMVGDTREGQKARGRAVKERIICSVQVLSSGAPIGASLHSEGHIAPSSMSPQQHGPRLSAGWDGTLALPLRAKRKRFAFIQTGL
jgi:hypothetical protein